MTLYPPDTGFEIRALAVWGRARYLSVTEAPHKTGENFVFFLCFFLLFSCFQLFLKIERRVRGYGPTNPSFFRIFGFFFNLTRPLSVSLYVFIYCIQWFSYNHYQNYIWGVDIYLNLEHLPIPFPPFFPSALPVSHIIATHVQLFVKDIVRW